VVICLQRGADLHMAKLMPLPLTVSCFSEIQIGFTFLVPAHPGSPGKRAVERVCVCVCVCVCASTDTASILCRAWFIKRYSACLSKHGPASANPLLPVCRCRPSGQEISVDCCSSGVWRANAGSATLLANVGN